MDLWTGRLAIFASDEQKNSTQRNIDLKFRKYRDKLALNPNKGVCDLIFASLSFFVSLSTLVPRNSCLHLRTIYSKRRPGQTWFGLPIVKPIRTLETVARAQSGFLTVTK